ncbi:MAG: hypothetical protein HY925_14095 [Elusimicrobia bacterium]|nr:hypothetical protein [Elusimicrobiota bacterium]
MARRAWIGAAVVVACFAAACGGPQSRVAKGRVAETIDQSPDRKRFLEAIGIGASDPALPTETQRKALSRDAAIVKAQYEMLSMLKGVNVEGGITVQRAIETDSTLEARLKETIKGAEIVKSEFTSDSGCVVTIRLPKKRLEDLMAVRWQ